MLRFAAILFLAVVILGVLCVSASADTFTKTYTGKGKTNRTIYITLKEPSKITLIGQLMEDPDAGDKFKWFLDGAEASFESLTVPYTYDLYVPIRIEQYRYPAKDSKVVPAGRYKLTLYCSNYWSFKATLKAEKYSASLSKVTLSTTKYTYNGKACQPTVKVLGKVNGKTAALTKGTDYTVTYKNNIKAGTATVIVKGVNGVKGTIKKTFTIKPAKILKVTLSSNSLPYTGKARKPIPTVKAKLNGEVVTLTKGTDYTVAYKNNIKAGTATVVITGKGNYTGTITKTFSIKK